MSCSCLDLERKYHKHECKCAHFRERFPDCKCEQHSVSEFSPGLVGDGEVLIRTIFNRLHIDEDGRINPIYFGFDPPRRGFSVDRLQYTNDNELISRKIIDNRYDGFLAFLGVRCREIRILKNDEDNRRLFCVYDSATSDNVCHVDICQNVYHEKGVVNRTVQNRRIAWKLWKVFSNPVEFPSQIESD